MEDTKKPTNDTATPNATRSAEGGKATGAARRVDRALAEGEAARVGQDEGESQTKFLQPAEGGSYRKNADGSLRRVEKPTRPEGTPAPKAESKE